MSKKSGDIDLYIETQATSIDDALKRKTDFIWDLEQKIGEQKIDVDNKILMLNSQLPIFSVAVSNGVRII